MAYYESNRDLLDRRIHAALKAMEGLDVGSDEYRKAKNDMETLYQLRLEQQKVDNALAVEQVKNRETEKSRVANVVVESLKVGVSVTTVVVAGILDIYLLHDGLTFEQTGAVQSLFVKNLIGKIGRRIK